jgi:protein associated with RNAse G/E
MVREGSELIELEGTFEAEVAHPELGVISKGTHSREFFWTSRWYNVFRFTEPNGEFRNFYCNVSMPPKFDGSVLEYVDLDLDLLVDRSGVVSLLDDSEFRNNSLSYGYPEDVIDQARNAVLELRELIGERCFPFDGGLTSAAL